ncbi:metacyclogenesis-specific protein [Trypanosoma cruzi cruzi]|uniref:Metacyclogenesis-specific protein n=1 Tax=Trypanosoma cruzi TaxID=5693 RepID=Q95W87_TRYCR|nr:metacyclogenesis-specific protein [Trypanosoma cruzi]PBJ78287.1 metacyclogenesis-specific protein [Trypanosoma cruzi cruzi]PBJ78290.1 metacyclogenesis-specific protein [Trypanosoma cruzi cruzi]
MGAFSMRMPFQYLSVHLLGSIFVLCLAASGVTSTRPLVVFLAAFTDCLLREMATHVCESAYCEGMGWCSAFG